MNIISRLVKLAMDFRGASKLSPNVVGPRMFYMSRNNSGVYVDESIALTYTAFWRAVNLISTTIASLQFTIAHRGPDGREIIHDNPVDYLLNVQANDEVPSLNCKEAIQAHVLTWGGGFFEIEQTRLGDPVSLWPITPDRVRIARTADGTLVYDVVNVRQPNTTMTPDQIFHLRGLAFDGVVGYAPVQVFKNSIGMGIAVERYGAAFFGNGASPSGVLQTDKSFGTNPEETEARIRASWNEVHQGPNKAHNVAILEDGLKWMPMGLPNDTAQFLESRKFQIVEMARIFGLPPHVLGDLERATHSNIEQQAIELVVYGLMPWIKRWEAEVDVKLLRRKTTGLYCKMNLNDLLRGDSAARATFYKTLTGIGVLSINEARAFEDMDPVDNGDTRLVPMNMVKLEDAGSRTQDPRAGAPPGGDGETPSQPGAEPDKAQTLAVAKLSAAWAAGGAFERFIRKASKATERKNGVKADKFAAWEAEFWPSMASEFRTNVESNVAAGARAVAMVNDVAYPRAYARASAAAGEWISAFVGKCRADVHAAALAGDGSVDLVFEGLISGSSESAMDFVLAVWKAAESE